jgi:hypothetical protein
MIVFPYSGYQKGSDREALFWKVVAHCREIAGDPKPTVVLNADTGLRGGAKAFQKDSRSKTVDVCRVWSVDTCQMWLAGWGHILDHYPRIERIVQLPGDLDWVEAHGEFFLRLDSFLVLGDPFNLIIGDFETSGRFSAKNLIDYYGTYALMANWFPEITNKILQMPLNRPRSEFLNVSVKTLRELLAVRKFAYEQTLNMLIRLWDFKTQEWKRGVSVHSHSFGTLSDESSFRQYRECLDQIERTERMLKMLWREIHVVGKNESDEMWDRYHELDQRSTSVRQNARIIIGNLLKVGS